MGGRVDACVVAYGSSTTVLDVSQADIKQVVIVLCDWHKWAQRCCQAAFGRGKNSVGRQQQEER